MRRAAALLLLLLLAAAGPTQAALNQPRPYSVERAEFQDGFDGTGGTNIFSGAFEDHLGPTDGSFGFLGTEGTSITGLTRVCWGVASARCSDSASGDLGFRVPRGGSFGLRAPEGTRVEADVEAAHALSLFIDFAGKEKLGKSFGLGRSHVASTVEGSVDFETWPAITGSVLPGDSWGGITPLDNLSASRIQVMEGNNVLGTLSSTDEPAFFLGRARVDSFSMDLAVVPFGSGQNVTLRAAIPGAAKDGLDIERLNGLLEDLNEADDKNSGGGDLKASLDLSRFSGVLSHVLDGAIIGLAGKDATTDDFRLVRFTTLEVRATSSGLAWEGRSPLAIEDGHVAGAATLVGPAFYALPWWSWLLWGLAVAAFVVRLVLHPPKRNQRWDRLRWIGWVAGPLMAILVFVLWDFETRAVWGTSILSFDAHGKAFLIVLMIQVVPMLSVLFAVTAPLRLVLRSGFLLGRQGTFMGLAGPIASILGYLIGAHLLRAYLDLYVSQVIGNLGG